MEKTTDRFVSIEVFFRSMLREPSHITRTTNLKFHDSPTIFVSLRDDNASDSRIWSTQNAVWRL